MPFTVTNQRNDASFECLSGESILDAALRANRIYPYGCRNGACGACKCDLISGSVDYGTYEEYTLTKEDIKDNKILLCQAKPLGDVVFSAEEIRAGSGARIKTLPCRVQDIRRAAEDVAIVRLQIPNTQDFDFVPGQYIDILLKDGQRRSFSIASLPEDVEHDGIEIHVRHVADGLFTPRVFNELKPRDLLRFEGPFGTYLLQSEPDQTILMIAGGTGFAPIKALISQCQKTNLEQNIHLFWGARDEQDLYLNELAEQWCATLPRFQYTPVISGGQTEKWGGETGFVHHAVLRHYEDVSQFDVYASGPPIMVDAVRDNLGPRGLKNERFFFDSFEYSAAR
ncbi:MAG: CDP-6-deoxy-delta-3,4-glucoseen reductase [Pseudomonadota bacterium]